ncbi:GAF domain-containing protein [Desulfothermus naphthae]
MNPSSFYECLLKCVSNVFDGYTSVLYLKDDSSHYKMVSYFSLGDKVDKTSVVEEGRGILGWILKNKKALVINDFSREKRRLCYYLNGEDKTIKSFMSTPLANKRGVLCVDSKKTYTFSPKDQKILGQFAELVSVFLEQRDRFINYSETEKFYNCLKLISSLKQKYPKWDEYLDNLLKILCLYTGFLYCIFATRDERGEGYYLEKMNNIITGLEGYQGRKFRINGGLIGWVFKNHKAIILSDDLNQRPVGALVGSPLKGEKFNTIVCLPIIVNLKTRGVLIFLDREKRVITQSLSEFFQLLIDHLSLFLENLYLKNKLRGRKKGR